MRRKPVPERSKISRAGTHAFARKTSDDKHVDIPMVTEREDPDDKSDNHKVEEKLKVEDKQAAPIAAAAAVVAPSEDAMESRARPETMMMPLDAILGAPPEMPPPAPSAATEDPTNMPGARNIPAGNPNDPAPAPGHVPKGDSRSFRRGSDFALIYRVQTFVISRFGVVGTRGQWRVVEYPTSAAAAHSYAKEASRFASEGFSDYRD
jgi:hypothetical protein